MAIKISANRVLTGRELAEAKRMEKLEKIRDAKKASKTKSKGLSMTPRPVKKAVKPKLTGREAAEAKQMEMAEKVRKDRKAAKAKKAVSSPTSARKRSSVPIKANLTRKESAGVVPKLGTAKRKADALKRKKEMDSLEKKLKGIVSSLKNPEKTLTAAETRLINNKNQPLSTFQMLIKQIKDMAKSNMNMGGMMSKKKSGYMSGGQSKLDKTKDGKISAADFKLMNKGGMSKKGKSGYMYGGMTKKKKK
tara:strand:- start:36 stop:782 length:747 start_codon:yes stop_codon:yes gene_type:complete